MGSGRVVILGGGLAGMAAALRLCEVGFEVELLEKRTVLGGRASSFIPPGETTPIDNCQHVLLGCCTNLIDFFERAGMSQQFRFYKRYLFLGPNGYSSISASSLPAPLHLLPSLLRFRDLTWEDRRAVARGMFSILRSRLPVADEPLLDWLRRNRQTPGAINNFWRAILTSALNEDVEHLSARPAVQVFWEAFLRNRKGYRMALPRVPLSELYSTGVLKSRCKVRLSTPVVRLNISKGRIDGLCLQSGETIEADAYISSLPQDSLAALFSQGQRALWPSIDTWSELEWSPITGVHLWFDRPITTTEHIAVLGRTIQWVFNKSALSRDESGPSEQYIQLVVSASRSLMTLRREELLALVLQELGELLPASKSASLKKSVIVKEAKSTLSFRPGSDDLRAGPDTPFENLFLAGDWTASGWPPTMEGAVRSGYRAAERVTEAQGRPQRFLVPDLPSDPLVRLLAASR